MDLSLDQCSRCGGHIIPQKYWDWNISPDCHGNLKFHNSGAYCSAFSDKEIEDYEESIT